MSTPTTQSTNLTPAGTPRSEAARDHLWGHFTRQSDYEPKDQGGRGGAIPTIVKGDGAYIWDDQGKKYFDGLSGLFVVQVGHGRAELAEAAAKQARELAFFPIWSLSLIHI